MSKLTDLMDMYLCMREMGCTRQDAYTILDILKKDESATISEFFDRETTKQEYLNRINRLQVMLSRAKRRIEELQKELKHKDEELENVPDNLIEIISQLHRKAIKEQSFRNQNKENVDLPYCSEYSLPATTRNLTYIE